MLTLGLHAAMPNARCVHRPFRELDLAVGFATPSTAPATTQCGWRWPTHGILLRLLWLLQLPLLLLLLPPLLRLLLPLL